MSHDGEVNHTAAEFLFILALSGVFILGFSIQGPTLPTFILPHWGKPQAGGMAKGPNWAARKEESRGERGLTNQGNHLTSTKVEGSGPPGKKRRENVAILTIASIPIFF